MIWVKHKYLPGRFPCYADKSVSVHKYKLPSSALLNMRREEQEQTKLRKAAVTPIDGR